MVMICQQCGDEGFTNAFIYCVKCLGLVIHRYCLDVLPKTFDEFVFWVCEDCKPKSSYQSTILSHNSLHTPEQVYTCSVKCEEIHSREKMTTNRDTSCLAGDVERDGCQETTIEQDRKHISLADSSVKMNLKKRKKRHTVCLVDETEDGCGNKVIRESDSEHVQLEDSPTKLDSKKKKTGNNSSVLERTEDSSCSKSIGELDRECGAFPLAPFKMQKKRTNLRKISSILEDSCHKLSTDLEQEWVPLAELCIREKNRKEKKKKKRCSDSLVARGEEDNGHGELTKESNCQGSPLANSQVKKRLKKPTKEKETGLVDVKDKSSSQLVIYMENNTCFVSETRDKRFQQEVHVDAQPIIDTIWTGSFDIANTDYETYAVGHVSSKACCKVLVEASVLPSLLSLEMFLKSDLWPKSFLENEPSDDNIALYFFPAAPEHERFFDSLMKDMMNKELAMRAVLTNAELLIFTSEELPQKFWRFRDKFYLWGVFRGKRVNPSPPANNYLLNSKGSDRCNPHTNSSKNMENGKRTLHDSNGSDRSDPRTSSSNKVESGSRSIHHEDARKSDCDEQKAEATVKDDHALVDSSIDADNTTVESLINANNGLVESHINADNSLVESAINADNALVESSINADIALVESFINADRTQDEDVTKHCDNQEMDSTTLVSKGSDPNHSRNTLNPVHSSSITISSEEALTHDLMPTVVPTTIPPDVCMTIIPETSLSQSQGISGTPTFQPSQTSSQSITANLVDMARIFNGVDSQEASTQSVHVKVGRYTVEQSLSSILKSILAKHGDIAQRCQLSDESTSSVLELICKVIQNLQELSLNKLRSRHLKYLNTILTEAKGVGIKVDWLKSRHDELKEILCFASLKDAIQEKIKAAESTKRTLGLKKAELVKAESEWESMEKRLTSLEAEYQSMDADISNMVAEYEQYMEKPLSDVLL